MKLGDLITPALVVERQVLQANIATMAAALPGPRLRPHVKAHKCTRLAAMQRDAGHHAFTCATIREVEGMAAAGLGEDLLLANEVLDTRRLGDVIRSGTRVTLAVDSPETIRAAAAGGVREVVIDVNVGLPRCGCSPEDAGTMAEAARQAGLAVRGVMGYEGHVVGVEDPSDRAEKCEQAMTLLLAAHQQVGGDLLTAGGTGTYALNTWATEIQAGSYALMDSSYAKLGLPFGQALFVLATVISTSGSWSVADAGLKAFGMDHGNPSVDGAEVWFCSDEHVVLAPSLPVGTRTKLIPAHLDPTVAYHETLHVIDGEDVLDSWPIDLRGW